MIKNPGGTIAPCGGYVAGKRTWVEAAAARLSAPGLGVDCGSMTGDVRRALFQGLFLSPQMVGEAIKVCENMWLSLFCLLINSFQIFVIRGVYLLQRLCQ